MSNAARWPELERLYYAALEKPPQERAGFIDQQCGEDAWLRGELASLLAHDQSAEGFLDRPALDLAARVLAESSSSAGELEAAELEEPSLAPGSFLGAYKVMEQIGRGGMGVVYRAQQQQPVRRDVAVKIIKPGMDSQAVIARFQAERQALALMDHPNIARVLDAGGTPAGRLYFVMELVEGLPVTDFCRQRALGLREKLALFVPICQAIHHAHQKGVIHRDIKPSNVLVTEYDGKPVPKVIDFGIAKAMREQLSEVSLHTKAGGMVGTLDYMSPEQANSGGVDIDTRSDVYSLGVLLYELITGTTPLHRASLGGVSDSEVLRRINEENAAAPSTRLAQTALQRQVRGDLDWVVMKALEKDRLRRYASVSALCEDVENYLAGAPVTAGPPSTWYRLKKLTLRHRAVLATAAAFVVLLAGAAIFSAREAIRARRAEQSAAAVNEFLAKDLLAQASAFVQANSSGRPDPELKVRTALDRAAARVEARFAGQPAVEASVRHTIGATYLDLGLLPEAERQLLRAVRLRQQELGEEDPETLASQELLASVYLANAKPALAEPLSQKVLAVRKRQKGEQDPDTLRALHNLASVERAFTRDTQAEQLYASVAALRGKVLGPEHPDTLQSLNGLGFVSMRLEKFAQAKQIHSRVLAIRRRKLGENHPETLQSKNALAQALGNLQEPEPAQQLLREVLEWRQRMLGPAHPDTLSASNSLGMTYSSGRKYAQAEAELTSCLDRATKAFGPDHPVTLPCRNNLAEVLLSTGKYAEAERHHRAALEMDQRHYGPEAPDTLRSLSNLGVSLSLAGRHEEARTLLQRAVEIRQRVLGPKNPKTLSSMDSLAAVTYRLGQVDEARKQFEKVAGLRREVLGVKHPRTLSSLTSWADILVEQRQYPAAEKILQEVLAQSDKDPWAQAYRKSLLGAALAGQGRKQEAEPLLREGYAELVAGQEAQPVQAREDVRRARLRLQLLGGNGGL